MSRGRLASAWRSAWTPPGGRLAFGSWLLLVLTIGAALVLRFIGLDHLPGINGDEAVFPVHAREWLAGVPLSELRTGTNLPMNPVFFGVVALLQALLPNSLWALRMAALTHSVLAVGLAFLMFRRRGVAFAAVFAALLAVLPIQLGYARLAWDPSAVATVLVLALAAATRGRIIASVLAFGLCFWVHPSTVFAGPILLAALIAARWPRDAAGELRRPNPWSLVAVTLAIVVALATGALLIEHEALPPPVLAALRGGLLDRIRERLTDPGASVQFARLYADFLAGPTIYRYVTGSMPSAAGAVHLVAAIVLFVALVLPALWRLPRATRTVDRALALGLLLSLWGAYLVGGLPVLTPHTERYGMFLVVPSAYVLAASVDAFASTPRAAALSRIGTAAVGVLLMASFGRYFLGALRHVDPERHNTFRTGGVDPKELAYEAILASRAQDRVTLVRAEDWWIYWPLRYLVGARGDLRVSIAGARWNYRFPRDFEEPTLEPSLVQVYNVAWAGSETDALFAAGAQDAIEIEGYGSDPVLHVYRMRSDER